MAREHPVAGLVLLGSATVFYLQFMIRIRKAQFPWKANLMAVLGLPLFVFLLLRSYLHSSVRGAVHWKGRKYAHSAPPAMGDSSILKGNSKFKG